MDGKTTSQAAAFDRLAGVDTWIFDLDNTLYPAASDLFTQVRNRMTAYICNRFGIGFDEARALQRRYYLDHGTTMLGLMHHHNVDPHEFMDFVHDIDLSGLAPSEALRESLGRLPGRRVIYTNASRSHAQRVMNHLGVADLFDDISTSLPPISNRSRDRMPSTNAAGSRRECPVCSIFRGTSAAISSRRQHVGLPPFWSVAVMSQLQAKSWRYGSTMRSTTCRNGWRRLPISWRSGSEGRRAAVSFEAGNR